MNKKRLTLLVPCLITLIAGCSPIRFYSSPGDDVYLFADYRKAVEHWMENAEINNGLIQLANANCVYRGWEVQQAYLRTVQTHLDPPEETFDRITQREMNRWRNGNEFLLGLYCYEEEWNTISGPDSKWNIRLVSEDGRTAYPSYIEKVDLPSEESEVYLNVLTSWRDVYRLIFPLADESGKTYIGPDTEFFEIHCNSMLGEMILRWDLER